MGFFTMRPSLPTLPKVRAVEVVKTTRPFMNFMFSSTSPFLLGVVAAAILEVGKAITHDPKVYLILLLVWLGVVALSHYNNEYHWFKIVDEYEMEETRHFLVDYDDVIVDASQIGSDTDPRALVHHVHVHGELIDTLRINMGKIEARLSEQGVIIDHDTAVKESKVSLAK